MQCFFGMKAAQFIYTLAAIGLAAPGALAQNATQPAPPQVDYWEPQWMQRELWGPGVMPPGMRARLLRHWTYTQYGVQKQYQGASSTVGASEPAIAAGARLYAANCTSCHGKDGLGDGDAAKSLLPSPALLAFMIQRPVAVDEYLLWSISEGGKQFETSMPAFKESLPRDDIWRIIAYMRKGFPGKSTPPASK
jgi:mono/diheme cytochrome c family protein